MMNGFYHIFEVFNLELFWKAWHVKEKGKVLQAFFNQKILRKVFLETTIHIEIA